MAHLLARLVAMNDSWARPFGEFNRRWVMALFRPMYPIKDLLNGRWLGHPLHAAVTDIPIGLLLGVVVLDIIGQPAAADVVLIGTIVFMVLAALAGLADYSDTTGIALTRATLHATIMVVTLLILIVSAVMRAGAPVDRTVPIALSIIGFILITAGAFVGGDVAYLFGNMVNRHAFRGPGTKWVKLDTGSVTDLESLPEATPTKMRAGINDLLVVRMGDTVHVMHNVCAHAGGPLNEGKLVDDCIECPWHGSRYRLSDGFAQRGPTVYDQPSYEVRSAEGGGYEVRRVARV
jgi:nitrite reductase/ring-hydroxylating ferredoxin subunit